MNIIINVNVYNYNINIGLYQYDKFVARTYHSVNHISGFPRYPQLNDYNYEYTI